MVRRIRPGISLRSDPADLQHIDSGTARSRSAPRCTESGRKAASAPEFDRFSAALRASGITLTAELLERWLEKPSALVPGNTMAFIGIPKEQDRINLVAHLMRQEE